MTTFTSEDRQAAEQARPQIAIGTIRPYTEFDEPDRPFEVWNGERWVLITEYQAKREK